MTCTKRMANIQLNMVPPGSPSAMSRGGSIDAWAIMPKERSKYDLIFEGLKPVNGLLSGDKVRPVLLNSKLPMEVLGRVWDLADIDKDGYLDKDEFSVAMHLVYRALEKEPVPMTLPNNLIPPSKKAKTLAGAIPGAVPVLPPLAAVPPTVSGDGPRSAGFSGGPMSPAPSTGTSSAATWVVTASDLLQCEETFKKTDTDMDGLVDGMQVRDVLLQYGAPQQILAQIWTLCDINNSGKLNSEQFALAIYLIKQYLAGIEPPSTLPPEMVPPTMRQGGGGASLMDGLGPINMEGSSKELDMISKEIEALKKEKMSLEQERTQKNADCKVTNSEVLAQQKELDSIQGTLTQLELQKGQAQEKLDDLDDRKSKLENSVTEAKKKKVPTATLR